MKHDARVQQNASFPQKIKDFSEERQVSSQILSPCFTPWGAKPPATHHPSPLQPLDPGNATEPSVN